MKYLKCRSCAFWKFCTQANTVAEIQEEFKKGEMLGTCTKIKGKGYPMFESESCKDHSAAVNIEECKSCEDIQKAQLVVTDIKTGKAYKVVAAEDLEKNDLVCIDPSTGLARKVKKGK